MRLSTLGSRISDFFRTSAFGLRISRRSPEADVPLSQAALAWLHGGDPDSSGASPVLSSAYEQLVWVYRAINVLAEQVVNIPFLFSTGQRGRESLITSGPLIDFYSRPHPQITRFQYWELRVIWLMLRGEWFRIPIYEDDLNLNLNLNPNLSLAAPERSVGGSSIRSHSALRTPHSALATRITHHASGLRTQHSKLKTILILDPAHFQHIVQDNQLIGWRYTGSGARGALAPDPGQQS